MANANHIAVKILGKEFQVNCPEGHESDLLEAACELDRRMTEIRRHGRVIGVERIAVMTALNLMYDLLQLKQSHHTEQLQTEQSLQNTLFKLEQAIHQVKRSEQPVEQVEAITFE